jgi:hypothetical protein
MKRSEQKLIAGPVEGYKIFENDMTCRGYQFSLTEHNDLGGDEPLEKCEHGFHFCESPSGVWAYYEKGRVFKIKAYGVLDQEHTPGADYKMVCERIEIGEEILVTGDRNTGSWNTGTWNTGSWNTGDRNMGDRNTGSWNMGDLNTGDRNTGSWNTGSWNMGRWNTGDRNTGDRNTGDGNTGDLNTGSWNTGSRNTGDRNTGSWNCGDYHSGFFNTEEAPLYLFGVICPLGRSALSMHLMQQLGTALQQDEAIDPTPFLAIPNATAARIQTLHNACIKARKEVTE